MPFSVVLAQINWNIGDIEGNADRIIELINQNQKQDLIVFSEFVIDISERITLLVCDHTVIIDDNAVRSTKIAPRP